MAGCLKVKSLDTKDRGNSNDNSKLSKDYESEKEGSSEAEQIGWERLRNRHKQSENECGRRQDGACCVCQLVMCFANILLLCLNSCGSLLMAFFRHDSFFSSLRNVCSCSNLWSAAKHPL